MSLALQTLQSLSLAEVTSLLFASVALAGAWREELRDFQKIEGRIARKDSVQDILLQTERVRRVSWRMGICTASMATLTLLLCGAIDRKYALVAGIVSWIWTTAALNFRAFHVEDPVYKILLQPKK